MTDVLEEWRDIAGQEGAYQVSNCGRVRSLDRTVHRRDGVAQVVPARVLQPDTTRQGYLRVRLPTGAVTVHKLVLAAFVGPCPAGMERAHNDGNRRNNHLPNLRYCTHAENVADKLGHGTAQRGSFHPRAKLSDEDIDAIRRSATLEPRRVLAEQFGIGLSQVGRIIRREAWS